MLSKRICEQCYEAHGYDSVLKEVWKPFQGRVEAVCPRTNRHSIQKMFDFADVKHPPPEYCPYALEHIIEADHARQKHLQDVRETLVPPEG